MIRNDRRKAAARRRAVPTLVSLEPRCLLTATPSPHVLAVEAKMAEHVAHVHEVRVERVAHAHVVHAEKVARAHAVHAEAVLHWLSNHPRYAATLHISPRQLRGLENIAGTADDEGTKASSDTGPVTGYYNPTQIQTAYGVSALGASNQGQGLTIGIVEQLHDPNILADANTFSTQYGLPLFDGVGEDPVLYDTVDSSMGTVADSDRNVFSGYNTSLETALDVEWVHSMAPKANIVIVSVPIGNTFTLAITQLLHGIQLAAAGGGVGTAGSTSSVVGASAPATNVVSVSYGYAEGYLSASTLTSLNNTYLASGAALNSVVAVSTGDTTNPNYPATSPNVVAVGGTSLYISTARGKYSFETGWGGVSGDDGGGGGPSAVFGSVGFQSNNGVTNAHRAIPDVSLDADSITAVSVYDSWSTQGGTPVNWTGVGGTSLATPLFAGMMSLAQQRRLAAGKSALTSAQIDAAVYSLYNSPAYKTYFHDVTLGNNRTVGSNQTYYSATTGYDLATGLGSPIANTLVPYLASL